MTDTEILLAALRADAARIDKAMREDLESLAPKVDGLLAEVLAYCLFNGGKRIRPLLVVIASRLCGRDDDEVYQVSQGLSSICMPPPSFTTTSSITPVTRRGRPSVNSAITGL